MTAPGQSGETGTTSLMKHHKGFLKGSDCNLSDSQAIDNNISLFNFVSESFYLVANRL